MSTMTSLRPQPHPPGRAVALAGFAVAALLWSAFWAAVVVDPAGLDAVWHGIRGLWWPVQGLAWVLFLPWLLGLRVWQGAGPAALRLPLILGLALATLGASFPRRAGP